MITVTVDSNVVPFDLQNIRTMGELVELIKVNIDPDSMITCITLGGRELVEADWRAPLSVHGTSELQVLTTGKEQFLRDRLEQAPVFIEQIEKEFSETRKHFRDGDQVAGHGAFSNAIKDLNAFFKWYDLLLQSNPILQETYKAQVGAHVSELTKICEQLVSQQLYNSWWALGETIETQLEPTLAKLRSLFQQLAQTKIS